MQTFTITGFGEDAPWQSPQMNLLVIAIQLAGIDFILSAVDVFVVPWLREALRPTAPKALSARSGHVIVCGYTPRVEIFIEEMDDRGQDYVLIESDAERASALYEKGHQVMEGDPTSTDTLERAHVARAKVLVADVANHENASIALAAREADPEGRVITLVEDASLAQYHRAARADVALSPRHLLGQSLAARVPIAAAANVEESVADHHDIDFAELVVTRQSPLHGRTLAEAGLSGRFGICLIGAWFNGSFETAISPETKLEDHVRLFVAGTADQLATLRNEVDAYVRAFTFQSILLAGYGDSGRAVAESLTNCTVLAISRESTFLTDPDDGGFTVEAGNEVVVAGTDDGIERFRDRIAELGA